MTLKDSTEGKEYIIKDVDSKDMELKSFLFSLGCYSGERVAVLSRKRSGCIVIIRDSRYHIDNKLAAAVVI